MITRDLECPCSYDVTGADFENLLYTFIIIESHGARKRRRLNALGQSEKSIIKDHDCNKHCTVIATCANLLFSGEPPAMFCK